MKSDESRLVVHRKTKSIEHRVFKDIIEYLNPEDCLVINDTKVIPARLLGKRKDTGGKMEFVLLSRENDDTWRVLVKPGKEHKLEPFCLGDGILEAEYRHNGRRGTHGPLFGSVSGSSG